MQTTGPVENTGSAVWCMAAECGLQVLVEWEVKTWDSGFIVSCSVSIPLFHTAFEYSHLPQLFLPFALILCFLSSRIGQGPAP